MEFLRRWWLVAAGLTAIAIVIAVLVPGSVPARDPHAAGATVALRSAHELGPLSASVRLRLELQLADRRGAALDRLIAAGRTVSPSEFERGFMPTRSAIAGAIHTLAAEGLQPEWTPGSEAIELDVTAGAAERAFRVQLDRYASGAGTFYAPATQPRLAPPLRGVISFVAGLDDRARVENLQTTSTSASVAGCGSTVGGLAPAQVMSAYDFGPLQRAALTGTGQTVVFIEIDTFSQSDLNCFAAKYGEAAPTVSVASERWGKPASSRAAGESETDLDLEIVHALAPGAHLVVYYADSKPSDIAAAAQAAVQAYPKAILSVSIGSCEVEALANGNPAITPDQRAWNSALQRLAGTGGSAFIASGDSGAYTCGGELTNGRTGAELLSVSFPASDPYAIAVGGTTLFLGVGNTYGGEAAWGGPFQAAGSGGGLSLLWRKPSWQSGAGVRNQYSDGFREVPDVSAVGDPNTGWNIFQNGSWSMVGGTSAAAPLWAALAALADQKLASSGLQPVGFASVPIYAFGSHPSKWPAPAFHDVTFGENLFYSAGRGWDYASGWGSPNAAGLVADLVAYRKGHS